MDTRAHPERRQLDYSVVRRTFPDPGGLVSNWAAYATIADAELEAPTREPELATVYEFHLRVQSLAPGGVLHDSWQLRVDASSRSYPAVPPAVSFVCDPKPWVPHVNAAGAVCLGDLFTPTTLIARFVVQVMRILNWDSGVAANELARHFHPEATQYWQIVHAGRPLCKLDYPQVEDASRSEDALFGVPFVEKST